MFGGKQVVVCGYGEVSCSLADSAALISVQYSTVTFVLAFITFCIHDLPFTSNDSLCDYYKEH